MKTIKLVNDFIEIVGSSVSSDNPNDVDILIRADIDDKNVFINKEGLIVALRKIFDPDKTGKLHFVFNPQGAHDTSKPVYDLVLVPKEFISKRVHPFSHYRFQKPMMLGYTEFFSADELWKNWASTQHTTLYISPKIDGLRVSMQKLGNEIRIYFEDSNDPKTELLPKIADELKNFPDIILEGELVAKKNGKWLSRPDMISAVRTKKEDVEFYVFTYDVLYYGGDVHDQPFVSRINIISKSKSEHIIPLKQYKFSGNDFKVFENLCKEALKFDAPLEGVVVRRSDMKYTFGTTDDYVKYKLYAQIKVKILSRNKTKDGNIVYTCGIKLNDNEYYNIGNTFKIETDIAKDSDFLEVGIEEFIDFKNGEYAWGKPQPLGPADRAYTINQVIDIAKRMKIYKESIDRSIDIDKYWEEHWKDFYPKTGKGRFVFQIHVMGLTEEETKLDLEELVKKRNIRFHGDLRLEYGDYCWGFTVFLGDEKDLEKIYSLTGRKFRGTFKLPEPKEWLTIAHNKPYIAKPNEVGATSNKYAKFFEIDSGTYTAGVWHEHFVEIFLNGDRLKGRYVIEYAPVGDQRIWIIEKPADQTPYAEKHEKPDREVIWNDGKGKPEFLVKTATFCDIIKAKEHYVLVPALVPNKPDFYGDIVDEQTIKEAAYKWFMDYRKAGIMHKSILDDDDVKVVESYIAPVDMEINGKKIKKGTWLLGFKIFNNKLWELIESGIIKGVSIEGFGRRERIQ